VASRKRREPVGVVSLDRPRRIATARPEPPKEPVNGKRVLANAALILLLGGTLAGLGWAFQSDTFRVRQVNVNATSTTVRQSVEDLVAPGCLESLPGSVECPNGQLGPSELTLSASEMQRQLQQIPLVKSAVVKLQLPDGLRIDIVERQPEAAWVVGSQIFRVANDGVVIDQGSPDGLKVVIGQVAGEPVKPGDKIDMEVVKGAELLQEQLPAALGIAARRIQYSPVDGLAVIGDQDFMAMFGPPQDLNLKMAELARVMQLAKDKKTTLAFVDVRSRTPYFRAR